MSRSFNRGRPFFFAALLAPSLSRMPGIPNAAPLVMRVRAGKRRVGSSIAFPALAILPTAAVLRRVRGAQTASGDLFVGRSVPVAEASIASFMYS